MTILSRFKRPLADFLIINLFVTLVSLPLLVAWGLPLSWLSPFGNLLFSPFLSTFLLLSTVSFFCELFCLPHSLVDQLLEWITQAWQWLMSLAPQNSFIGFSLPTFWALVFISLATLFVTMLAPFSRMPRRISALSILFMCSIAVLKAAQPASLNTQLHCTKKEMILLHAGGQTMLVDHGALCERANPASWVQYHLVPDLIKTTGSMQINQLILPKPTIRACEAAAALLQHAQIQHLFYPKMHGSLSGSHRGAFFKLYAIAKEKGVQLHCVENKKQLLLGNKKVSIEQGKKMKYRELEFSVLKVTERSLSAM